MERGPIPAEDCLVPTLSQETLRRWRCPCGYSNVGYNPCAGCHRPAPRPVVANTDTTPTVGVPSPHNPLLAELLAARDSWPEAAELEDGSVHSRSGPGQRPGSGPGQRPGAAGQARRTVWRAIGLGLLLQIVSVSVAAAGHLEPEAGIKLGLLLTLGFYVVVLAMAVGRMVVSAIRPRWTTVRGFGASVAAGLLTGVLMLAGVFTLMEAVSGHVVVDPTMAFVVSEGTLVHVLLAVALSMVAAPFVEELLFRGLLAESLREHGPVIALVVSGTLFAAWHLRLVMLPYYLVLGLALGAAYWKRGLVASMSAHAVFNGTLLAIVVVAAHGPSHLVANDGASMTVPATWHGVTAKAPAELALRGPSGAGLVVVRIAGAVGLPAAPDLSGVSAGAAAGAPSGVPSGLHVEPTSVLPVVISAGTGTRAELTLNGHHAIVVWLNHDGQGWGVVFLTAGSGQARHDFERMLPSLSLPE